MRLVCKVSIKVLFNLKILRLKIGWILDSNKPILFCVRITCKALVKGARAEGSHTKDIELVVTQRNGRGRKYIAHWPKMQHPSTEIKGWPRNTEGTVCLWHNAMVIWTLASQDIKYRHLDLKIGLWQSGGSKQPFQNFFRCT